MPLAWLLAVTVTAGWQKIFSNDPRLGFLSAATVVGNQIAAGGSIEQLAAWHRQQLSHYVNTGVTAAFLILVLLVFFTSLRLWLEILRGCQPATLREDCYLPVSDRPPSAKPTLAS